MMAEKTSEGKAASGGNVCGGGCCPFNTPFWLATFLVGSMVIFYGPAEYRVLGWITVALGYLNVGARALWTKLHPY